MTWGWLDLRGLARWSAPPALAWLIASVLTWWVAASSNVAYWTAAGRERWDSVHYLSIARSGYEMFNCWDRPGYQEAGFRDVICGNVAWFPGYPMAVRIVSATGLSFDVAAIVVSELALLGMFAALWWLLGSRLSWATGLTMSIAVVFPGGIYYHDVFPIALGTLALMISVVGVKRGSWVIAATGGFVASSCHLVGAVVVGMLALSVFFAWRSDSVRVRIAKAGGSAAIAYGGVLFAKWMMWRATGHWNAYEEINRSSYGQGDLRNPFSEFDDARHFDFSGYYQPHGAQTWLVEHSLHANQWQLWVNLAFVMVVVVATAWRFVRQRSLELEEWAALLLVGAIFLTPFVAGAQMSWYRNDAQMFVALILVKPLPRLLQVALLVVLVPMYVFLAAMVFAGVLV